MKKLIESTGCPSKRRKENHERSFTNLSTVEGLPPLIDKNSRFLILGTMPGRTSLEQRQYYADSRNQFWKIMEILFGVNLKALSYEKKKKELLERGIALWDALSSCYRTGSLDKDIRKPVLNDLRSFLQSHPCIERVFLMESTQKNSFESLCQNFYKSTSLGTAL